MVLALFYSLVACNQHPYGTKMFRMIMTEWHNVYVKQRLLVCPSQKWHISNELNIFTLYCHFNDNIALSYMKTRASARMGTNTPSRHHCIMYKNNLSP